MILGVQSRRAARLADAARFDQPNDALTLSRPRGEELQHRVVVDTCSGEGVPDRVGEVEVADADGIGVAETSKNKEAAYLYCQWAVSKLMGCFEAEAARRYERAA